MELVSFKGEKLVSGNLLSWTTTAEINNEGFWLQKSSDGNNFENLAWIRGVGSTTELKDYKFLDEDLSYLIY